MKNDEQKSEAAKSTKSNGGQQRERSTKSKGRLWTFPKNTLEDSINVAKAIEDKNAGNPMRAPELAKAL